MLRQLDPRRLDALSREGNPDERLDFDPCDHIGLIRYLITEEEDWSTGVLMLLQDWPGVFKVVKYRKTALSSCDDRGPDDWKIVFQDYPFQELTLRLSSGGFVDIFVFEKRVQSFQIIGCRRNWPAMIEWIWHYGNTIATLKPKQKVRSLQTPASGGSFNAVVVSKPHIKSRGQRRRVEKPLLHKVLQSAEFKAQHGKSSKAKDMNVAPGNTDLEMGDVDAIEPLYSTGPDTANASGRTGSARGMNDDQKIADGTLEGIDIAALEVVDHMSCEHSSLEP